MRVTIVLVLLFCLSCKSPEARIPETVQSGSFLKESAERSIKLNNLEKEKILELIKGNPSQEYIASKSGFWYTYTHKITNDNLKPEFGDILNFDYNLSTLDGELIYSKEDLGNKTYVMDREELFTGLREGLKLMKAKENVTFIFPSQKAYGYYGDDNKIGANVPLVCTVTLNSIQKNND